jgi:CRP-like cAMP-binding protein
MYNKKSLETIKFFKQSLEKYGEIDPRLWLQIESLLTIKKIDKNTPLVAFGETPKMIYFVVSGVFRSYFLDQRGKTYTKNLFFTENLMGSMPALINTCSSALQIEALCDAKVICIPFARLKELMQKDLALQSLYITYLEKHWVVEQEEVERSLVMESADVRYKRFLNEEPHIDQLVPDYIIADHLGISPTQLSRIRRKLKSLHM